MKVNMTPNPLDVVTIHASQGDTEARQWEFELHNNGELIDTSEITEQMVFKSYKGGTEQILPENTSTPTTSPFKGDIKYPQGLLSDQEFTYRQSPTEEDGLAKVNSIKGNTLVWNQQLHLLSSTYWVQNNASVVFADGVGTFTATGATFGCYVRSGHRFAKTGHKYLFSVEVTSSQSGNVNFGLQNVPSQQNVVANTKTRLQSIVEATTDNTNVICYKTGATEGDTFVVSNFIAIDLTQMGLDISSPSEFTSLFSLPYYAYNQGTLLSFMGNGIKTTNADETEESTLSLPISTYFPSGMKSAGSVYDELNGTKATTRIGEVDLGSLTWTVNSTYNNIFQANLVDCKQGVTNQKANILCAKYETEVSGANSVITTQPDKTIRVRANSTVICILDSTYSTAEALTTALDGVYLYYELATPTETSFTTASLVTENAEIQLSNEDGTLIGKCTEELSAEPGFHDAKIKLSDSDGECYSNKIQLHIERSPQ